MSPRWADAEPAADEPTYPAPPTPRTTHRLPGDRSPRRQVLATLGEVIGSPWSGAVADLHDMLTGHLGDTRPPREWPKTARALAVVLKRPCLSAFG